MCSLLVWLVNFLDQYKMDWFSVSQSKFKGSIWVHQIAYDACNFGGLYLLCSIFIFHKICWVVFPLKSSYCGIIFSSIQVVLNVWEQFEVQNPNIFKLLWTLATSPFFVHYLFSIIVFEKVVHTILCEVQIQTDIKYFLKCLNVYNITIDLFEMLKKFSIHVVLIFEYFWNLCTSCIKLPMP